MEKLKVKQACQFTVAAKLLLECQYQYVIVSVSITNEENLEYQHPDSQHT